MIWEIPQYDGASLNSANYRGPATPIIVGDYVYSRDMQTLFNWLFIGSNVFNVLLTGLFGWLSWRRLNRMAY